MSYTVFALGPLNLGISSTMAGIAEGDEVWQLVRFFVAVKAEQAERLDVMNVGPRAGAVLAGVIIALQSLAPLCLPVRATVITEAEVLRVVETVPVRVATFPRAVLSATLSLVQPALVYLESVAAVEADAIAHWRLFRARLLRRVLAFRRAVLTASMGKPTRFALKQIPAVGARQGHTTSEHTSIGGLSAQHRHTFARIRAVLGS